MFEEIVIKVEPLLEYNGDEYPHSDSAEDNIPIVGLQKKTRKRHKLQISLAETDSSMGKIVKRKRKNLKKKTKKTYTCKFCGESFPNLKLRNEHMPTHKDSDPHVCPECGSEFSNYAIFQKHIKAHKNDGLKCEEVFPVHSDLREHRRSSNRFQCEFCDKIYTCGPSLTSHLVKHQGSEPYFCTFCQARFVDKKTWTDHLKTHNDKSPYKCDDCEKIFSTKAKLKRHSLIHCTFKPLVKHVCHICFGTFSSQYHVERHYRSHQKHDGAGEFKAILEDPLAYMAQAVLQSQESTSVNPLCDQTVADGVTDIPSERIYECTVCKKTFKLHYYLKLHMRIHTGEKPYQCQLCDKSFVTSSKLTRHNLTHSGVKRYKCCDCAKSFTRPSYLRMHQRTHKKREKILTD